jgi:uncharacterized protein YtpQ (UPF0354 family)
MNLTTSIAYFKATYSGDDDGEVSIELDRGDLPVCINFADDFSIFFLADCGEYFEMVQVKHLEDAGISEEALLEIGKRNLGSIAHNIEITENNGVLYFTGSGNFEASLLLVPEIWNEWLIEYCPRGYVAALPARDILVVTDLANSEGIDKLVSIVDNIWPDGDHLLTKNLFHYKNSNWKPYQNA